MEITIYTVCYNEEIMLPFFIKWYKERFPSCKIVIYDNESTDDTVKIALDNNCEIITYSTNNQMKDGKLIEIKNNCWKNATTDWVIVCDCDEHLDINQEDLKAESENGVTIITTKGYDVVNLNEDYNIDKMNCGCNSPGYSKKVLFNKSKIKEINYSAGCHIANPIGTIIYSKNVYNMFHKMYVNTEFLVNKYERNNKRLSAENIKNGWSVHYKKKKELLIEEIKLKRKTCEKIKKGEF
jgi:glycosyltransferase involved in cell wall biosynthesis